MLFTVNEIADLLQGELIGNGKLGINEFCAIQEAVPGSITFLANARYEKYLQTTRASAVIVQQNFKPTHDIPASLILVKDPYASFVQLLKHHQTTNSPLKKGVELPSHLGEHVEVGINVYRGAFSYIGNHVTLGNGVQIYPHSYLGDHVTVGQNTIIYSGVKIYPGTQIGNDCIIHAGAVIGSDGFGFLPRGDGSYEKIPHIGKVILEDAIEIGANTTIDRATLGHTHLKKGTKIDNLVQVAHNVEIGTHTVVSALTGLAGSAKIGNHCILGGQVGVTGHTAMGDHTVVSGQSGVTKSHPKGHVTLMGMPAMERKKYIKMYVIFKRLHDIYSKSL